VENVKWRRVGKVERWCCGALLNTRGNIPERKKEKKNRHNAASRRSSEYHKNER
jgi:hypothetical protein